MTDETPQGGWPQSEIVAVTAEAEPTFTIEERDALINTWLTEKTMAEAAVAAERETRAKVTSWLFPTPAKGTQRYPLNNGYAVKLVYGYTYTLGDKDKIDEAGRKVPVYDQALDVIEAIENLGEKGKILADRLIKFKPELSGSEYEKLDVSDPIERQVRDLIDGILTVKPNSPQLTFETPKGR